ncbi:hypothetical protein OAD32_06725 [Porticoccaceae bacterium]|jgi:hypothetical protein|nr:hypothetical protein [Porticoccaceae bacterium]
MNVVFTDGIANVRLIDGVVRFDLVTALSGPNEESKLEKNGSLMLSVPGLVRMQGQLTDVVNKLVEDGVLQQDKKEPKTSK